MQKKMDAIIVLTVVALSTVVLMGSCSRTGESRSGHKPLPEESAMTLESKNAPSQGTIPPIDAAAPPVFDTATFGLG